MKKNLFLQTVAYLFLAINVIGCGSESVDKGEVDSPQNPQVPQTAEVQIDAIASDINAIERSVNAHNKEIFNTGTPNEIKGMTWKTSWYHTAYQKTYIPNQHYLLSNNSDTIKALGVWQERDQDRFFVLGGNPFSSDESTSVDGDNYANSAFKNDYMSSMVQWLTRQTEPAKVVVSQMHWRNHNKTVDWFELNFRESSVNANNSCYGEELSACIDTDTDLLIISSENSDEFTEKSVLASAKKALKLHVPIIFVASRSTNNQVLELSIEGLFGIKQELENIASNNTDRAHIINLTPSKWVNEDFSSTKRLLTHFKNNDFSIDWTLLTDGRKMHSDDLLEIDGMGKEFSKLVARTKKQLDILDKQNIDIFEEDGYELLKSMLILADTYRADVKYPLIREVTPGVDDNDLIKSFYADSLISYSRKNNKAQPSMGTFSRSDFSKVPRVTKTVKIKARDTMRSIGLYAIPGEKITITRLDDSDTHTDIMINTLKVGSTKVWKNDNTGYSRPAFLRTPIFTLNKDKPLVISTPHGGPIQVIFKKGDRSAVTLKLENVGQHPYWRSGSDVYTMDYLQDRLAEDYFDWVEVATDGIEIHSTREKFLDALTYKYKDINGDSVIPVFPNGLEDFLSDMKKFSYSYPNSLAGNKGVGIREIPAITDFVANNGWEQAQIFAVVHGNADRAKNGGASSGNPFDMWGAFTPTSHLALHEYGHALQQYYALLSLHNYDGHTVTGVYTQYTKSIEHKRNIEERLLVRYSLLEWA